MQLSLVAAPTVAPVSLAEVKAHLRIEHSEEDDYVTGLISAVASRIDGPSGWLRRALINQTYRLNLPYFPVARCIALPLPPLQTVESVSYFDHNDEEQTFPAEAYHVVKTLDEAYIYLKTGASWPGTWERPDAVAIEFVAGYGAASADVPANIRHAMLIEIGSHYAERGDAKIEANPNATVRRLLGPHKRVLMR